MKPIVPLCVAALMIAGCGDDIPKPPPPRPGAGVLPPTNNQAQNNPGGPRNSGVSLGGNTNSGQSGNYAGTGDSGGRQVGRTGEGTGPVGLPSRTVDGIPAAHSARDQQLLEDNRRRFDASSPAHPDTPSVIVVPDPPLKPGSEEAKAAAQGVRPGKKAAAASGAGLSTAPLTPPPGRR